MPDAITNLLKKITDFWKKLEKSHKIRLIIGISIVVLAVAIWIIFTAIPRYTPLTEDGLPSSVLTQMRQVLTENQVKFKLNPDRSGILVNERDFENADFLIKTAGITSDTMNIDDVFSKIKINTTESDKDKVWRQYDVEKLQEQIKMIQDIIDARVTIVRPDQMTWVQRSTDLQNKPSASVSLVTRRDLSSEVIQSIVNLVSYSVLNLDPSMVTIVDQNGRNLINNMNSNMNAAEKQTVMMADMASYMESKVRALYGSSDMYDSLGISAMPYLDFSTEKITDKDIRIVDALDGGALISSRSETEEATGSNAAAEPGTGTNPGNYENPTYLTGSDYGGTYSRSLNERNLDYPTTITEKENSPGAMIPDKTTASIVFYYGTGTTEPITAEWLTVQQNAIAMALGIPAANVSVTSVKKSAPAVAPASFNEVLWSVVNTYGIYLLLILLAVVLLILALPRRRRQPDQQLVPVIQGAEGDIDIENYDELEQIDENDLAEIETSERSEIKKQLDKFIEQKPDAVAQLLRNWLTDEWD